MRTRTIALLIFLSSLVISLLYNFTTNCFTVYDAARDYWLFNYYRINPVWHPMEGVNGLQNTALFSGYIPGVIQWATHLPADVFFKVYIALGIAVVPVLVFLICRKLVGKWYAVFSAIYLMGWVAFYQGGSYARLNFAVILFCLIILTYLSKMSNRKKIILSVILAALLPFAHYGTAIVSLVIFSGLMLAWLWKKSWLKAVSVGVVCLSMLTSFVVWHLVVNHVVWQYASSMIGDTVIMAQKSVSEVSRIAGTVIYPDDTTTNTSPLSVSSRDKITQAMFGSDNPDNANTFHYNAVLLLAAWVTVMMTLYGCWIVFRGDYSVEFKAMLVMMLVVIGVTVLSPQVSRGYGIEKTYYQAITVTGVAIVIAGERIAGRLHIPVWTVLGCTILPYVGLMWAFGRIVSIQG